MTERTYDNNPITEVQEVGNVARVVGLRVTARAFHEHRDLRDTLRSMAMPWEDLRDGIITQLLDEGFCDVELELRY